MLNELKFCQPLTLTVFRASWFYIRERNKQEGERTSSPPSVCPLTTSLFPFETYRLCNEYHPL